MANNNNAWFDLPQVDLCFFISLERSEGESWSDEVASVSDVIKGESNRLGKKYWKGLLENLMSGLQVIPVILCYTCYKRN